MFEPLPDYQIMLCVPEGQYMGIHHMKIHYFIYIEKRIHIFVLWDEGQPWELASGSTKIPNNHTNVSDFYLSIVKFWQT